MVLRKVGASDQRQEMFPDTGGYSRTRLYRLKDGRFLIVGPFDSFVVDATAHQITAGAKSAAVDAAFLGVFDDTGDGRWRFIAEALATNTSAGAN